ncbi:uncharacterized protein LOC115446114 [Manduca sexta]|uniref:uncharacterized protein LOC115446114 n=1 Tax=Manduca sexta TaxID=7130 RepID=UPI00118417F4|nr:uncharacterized protein LOC115446114 [Manduca sexta]
MSTKLFCVLLAFCFGVIYCYLEIIPERIDIPFTHPDHVVNASAIVKRYGRRSPYYIVGRITLKQTWNNNVTIHMDVYEYLHNEYRLSFMTVHNKLCNLINTDILLGIILRRLDIGCPLYPGLVEVRNATFKWEHFPYVIPYTKALANITLHHSATNELLMWLKLHVRVKQHGNKKN